MRNVVYIKKTIVVFGVNSMQLYKKNRREKNIYFTNCCCVNKNIVIIYVLIKFK